MLSVSRRQEKTIRQQLWIYWWIPSILAKSETNVPELISDNKIDLKDFKVLNSSTGDVTLASAPAYKVEYTYTDDTGQNLKGLETGTIIGNRVYFAVYENSPAQYDRDLSCRPKNDRLIKN